ncbi:hypothetical protein CTI12_AA142870 [Artemisia annua]|uniref:Uncharacterized protein n=1 Tax=Artemisia annua TaxID=35608 RepID=A0A2U1P4R1_ARTAN|nr:hypothetical protein CTI12_AA142870 [Artemisia annua]
MCQHEVKVAWVTMCHGSKGAEQDRVNYYQEADNVLPHLDSSTTFTKSMITWASWVEKNINPRSSAPSHSKGGESNDGGQLITESMVTHRLSDAMVTAERVTYAIVAAATGVPMQWVLSHGSKKSTQMVQEEMPKNLRLQLGGRNHHITEKNNCSVSALGVKRVQLAQPAMTKHIITSTVDEIVSELQLISLSNGTPASGPGLPQSQPIDLRLLSALQIETHLRYINLDVTGWINMELVISENDITADGAVLHLTSADGFSFLSAQLS